MRFVIPFFCFFLLFGCKNNHSESTETPSELTSLTGVVDFDKFYYRFHSDSIFQVNHIQFPLQGIPSNAGELEIEESTFRWEKENWVAHKLITSAEFESTFQVLDETLITEFIIHKEGTMGMKRRFSKSESGWNLIYYAAMNPLKIHKN